MRSAKMDRERLLRTLGTVYKAGISRDEITTEVAGRLNISLAECEKKLKSAAQDPAYKERMRAAQQKFDYVLTGSQGAPRKDKGAIVAGLLADFGDLFGDETADENE